METQNQKIIQRVSKELGIDYDVVLFAYRSYWNMIRDNIINISFNNDISKEDFGKIKNSFNIPALGKLGCTYDNYIGMKKRFEYINKLKTKINGTKINKN